MKYKNIKEAILANDNQWIIRNLRHLRISDNDVYLAATFLPQQMTQELLLRCSQDTPVDGTKLFFVLNSEFNVTQFTAWLEEHPYSFSDGISLAHFHAAAGNIDYFHADPDALMLTNRYGFTAYGFGLISEQGTRIFDIDIQKSTVFNVFNTEKCTVQTERDYEIVIEINMKIADVFYKAKLYNEAINPFKNAIAYAKTLYNMTRRVDTKLRYISALNTTGACYRDLNEVSEATHYFKTSIIEYHKLDKLRYIDKIFRLLKEICYMQHQIADACHENNDEEGVINAYKHAVSAFNYTDCLPRDALNQLRMLLLIASTAEKNKPLDHRLSMSDVLNPSLIQQVQDKNHGTQALEKKQLALLDAEWGKVQTQLEAQSPDKNIIINYADILLSLCDEQWQLKHYIRFAKICKAHPGIIKGPQYRAKVLSLQGYISPTSSDDAQNIQLDVMVQCIFDIISLCPPALYDKDELKTYMLLRVRIAERKYMDNMDDLLEEVQHVDEFLEQVAACNKNIDANALTGMFALVKAFLVQLHSERENEHQVIVLATKTIALFTQADALQFSDTDVQVYCNTYSLLARAYYKEQRFKEAKQALIEGMDFLTSHIDLNPGVYAESAWDGVFTGFKELTKHCDAAIETQSLAHQAKAKLEAAKQTSLPTKNCSADLRETSTAKFNAHADTLGLIHAHNQAQIKSAQTSHFKRSTIFSKKAQDRKSRALDYWASNSEQVERLRGFYQAVRNCLNVKKFGRYIHFYSYGRDQAQLTIDLAEPVLAAWKGLLENGAFERHIRTIAENTQHKTLQKTSSPSPTHASHAMLTEADHVQLRQLFNKIKYSCQLQMVNTNNNDIQITINYTRQLRGERYELLVNKQRYLCEETVFDFMVERLRALGFKVEFNNHQLNSSATPNSTFDFEKWRNVLLEPLAKHVTENYKALSKADVRFFQRKEPSEQHVITEQSEQAPAQLSHQEMMQHFIYSLLDSDHSTPSVNWLEAPKKLKNRIIFPINIQQAPTISVADTWVSPAALMQKIAELSDVPMVYHDQDHHHPKPCVIISSANLAKLSTLNGELETLKKELHQWLQRHAKHLPAQSTVVGVRTTAKELQSAASTVTDEEEQLMSIIEFENLADEATTHRAMASMITLPGTTPEQCTPNTTNQRTHSRFDFC